jgi:hypothetical protein
MGIKRVFMILLFFIHPSIHPSLLHMIQQTHMSNTRVYQFVFKKVFLPIYIPDFDNAISLLPGQKDNPPPPY